MCLQYDWDDSSDQFSIGLIWVELYVGTPLFDKQWAKSLRNDVQIDCDLNLEEFDKAIEFKHLALMERILGQEWWTLVQVTQDTPIRGFRQDSSGNMQLNWASYVLAPGAHQHVRSQLPLRDLIPPHEELRDLFSLAEFY